MFESKNQTGGRRTDDEMLRRMLFGGGNRRPAAAQHARPVMEPVPPQSGNGDNGGAAAPSSFCMNACSLAMVYSPKQEWQELYSMENALSRGTLFRELDKPFEGKTLLGR